MHLTLSPTELAVTVAGERVECATVVVEAVVGQTPRVTITPLQPLKGQADGVVQVVTPPTPQQVDDAAREALSRVDKAEFQSRCQARFNQGARDPFQVALDVLVEMTDG